MSEKIDPGTTQEMQEIHKQVMLREAMNSCFAFGVGEFVVPRSILEAQKLAMELRAPRSYAVADVQPLVPDCIMQRYAQECPGGIQRHYEVRRRNLEAPNSFGASGYTEVKLTFLEHELASWGEAVETYRKIRTMWDVEFVKKNG